MPSLLHNPNMIFNIVIISMLNKRNILKIQSTALSNNRLSKSGKMIVTKKEGVFSIMGIHTGKLVEIFFDAYKYNQTISEEAIPEEIDKDQAYTVQHKVTDMKSQFYNDKLIGYKISLTSEDTQKMFGATSPIYGSLTNTNLSGGSFPLEKLHSPLIEVELMFIANEHLTKADDYTSILQKMSIAPGLEIPDSRFLNWFPNLSAAKVIADSAVTGKVVVGEAVNGMTYEQLGLINASLKHNGEPIAQGASTEVLGNPVHAVKWLLDELAECDRIIEKGMVISSGTLITPQKLTTGNYEASLDHFGTIHLNVE